MKYKVTVPPTREMGSYATTTQTPGKWGLETYRQRALWDYNSARAHDGLPPVSRMPAGTHYKPCYEYVLQGHYGHHGWEDLCVEETRQAAKEQLKCYRENEGGTYRIKMRPEQ